MDIQLANDIVKEAYILIPVFYVIGLLLKRTPKLPDWLIPWILLVLGMAGGFFLNDMQFKGVLKGVLVTGVTVFSHQLYKQTARRLKHNKTKKKQ